MQIEPDHLRDERRALHARIAELEAECRQEVGRMAGAMRLTNAVIDDIERRFGSMEAAMDAWDKAERLERQRTVLLDACHIALGEARASRDGGRMMRRDTLIRHLEAALAAGGGG